MLDLITLAAAKAISGGGGGGSVTPAELEEALTLKSDKSAVTELAAPTSLTLADNTEYYLTNVSDLSITYPSGRFEAWIRLTTATSGTVTIELPTSQYIGTAPTFGNGETWEISIKDGVVIAQKVGDGE